MKRLPIALIVPTLALAFACADEPDEPNAFMTNGTMDDDVGTDESGAPVDMMAETGGNSADETTTGDGDTTTTGDGDTTDTTTDTTTTGDGDTTTTTTTGGAVCGNGTIDDGEQCDGGNLGGFSCADLGYSGGTLACDPVTCTYDASGCTTDTNTGGTTG